MVGIVKFAGGSMRRSVLLVVLISISVCDADAQIPQVERDALISLHTGTDGNNWTNNALWLGGVGTECTWNGVRCSEGHVQRLALGRNQLSGRIPPELGNLSNLEILELHSNHLDGSIPPELGNLSNLSFLHLGYNQLSGSIPPEFGNLSRLRYLSLYENQLSGSIPPELGNLSSLLSLNLYDNQLSGSIPPELGNLSSLLSLYLYDNQLSGSIPPELGNLSNMRVLNLSDNQLSGSIPPELGNLSSGLRLRSNRLSGSIPPELGVMPGSNRHNISFNALWTDDWFLQMRLASRADRWYETQTIAPERLNVVSVADRTVWLEWAPILYTDGNGGYEVFSRRGPRLDAVSGGYTSSKLETAFPVTALQPGQTYDFTVSTFTSPHHWNHNTVVSDSSSPVMATTSNAGCGTPVVTVSGNSAPYTLTVTSTHDNYEWVTGETTSSIMVSPQWTSCYWVNATGPGSCEEAAVVLVHVPAIRRVPVGLSCLDGHED
jgi:hypothetical protein